jgi:omega-amidase
MSTLTPAPAFKPFNLALIQLGQVGPDKAANLKHARDMIRKAASGNAQGKPDLIALPVSASRLQLKHQHKIRTCFPAGML